MVKINEANKGLRPNNANEAEIKALKGQDQMSIKDGNAVATPEIINNALKIDQKKAK